MKFFTLALIAFMITISAPTQAVDQLGKVCKIMPMGTVFKATFSQQKFIKGIQKPLNFRGEVLVQNGHGLLWETKSPFTNSIYISKTGIFQLDNGEKKSLVKGHQDRAILESISKVLSGNFNAIHEFTIKRLASAQGKWSLELTPASKSGFSKAISSLVVDGGRRINTIAINRSNGDRDIITILSQETLKALPEDAKAIFND
jgi:hypothetical protein